MLGLGPVQPTLERLRGKAREEGNNKYAWTHIGKKKKKNLWQKAEGEKEWKELDERMKKSYVDIQGEGLKGA